ncbi:MAG: EamA family transporter [Rhodobacteraceae bacterium]|nr:EamA family transporter [Paracoccaceae bacterium]
MNPAPTHPPKPPNPPHKVDNLRGIWWILLSVLGSSAMAVAVRDISTQIDSRTIVFLRSAISSGAILLALILFARLRAQLRFSQPMRHLIRGSLIAASTHFGFHAIAKLPMATVTVLFFLAPIWATLLAILIHKERVGPRRIVAITVGFAGAMVILRPGFGSFEPAMLAALASSFLFALALNMSRGLAQVDGATSAYFSSVIITALVSLPFAWPVLALPADMRGSIALSIVVVAGALRGYADIEAYRHGEAGLLAPITYLRLVLIATAAYFMYQEVPDKFTIIGALIVISATLYIALREARLKRLSGRSAPP